MWMIVEGGNVSAQVRSSRKRGQAGIEVLVLRIEPGRGHQPGLLPVIKVNIAFAQASAPFRDEGEIPAVPAERRFALIVLGIQAGRIATLGGARVEEKHIPTAGASRRLPAGKSQQLSASTERRLDARGETFVEGRPLQKLPGPHIP